MYLKSIWLVGYLFLQVVDNLRAAPEDKRFNRLKNLLDRSNVYAQFLLKRMDQQREQEKARREAKEKVKEKRDADSTKQKEENQVWFLDLCILVVMRSEILEPSIIDKIIWKEATITD